MATWSAASSSPSNKPTESQVLRCRLFPQHLRYSYRETFSPPWGWYNQTAILSGSGLFLGCLAESASASGTREALLEPLGTIWNYLERPKGYWNARSAYPYSKMCELCELCELFVKTAQRCFKRMSALSSRTAHSLCMYSKTSSQ